MNLKNIVHSAVQLLNNENGYYYYNFEKEKDKSGNERIKADTSTLNLLIICVTVLFVTILLLAYQAKLFSHAIVFLIVLSFLIFMGYSLRVARSASKNVHINKILFVLLVLCLVLLCYSISDILNIGKILLQNKLP